MPILVSILVDGGVVQEVRASQMGIDVELIDLDSIHEELLDELDEDDDEGLVDVEVDERVIRHERLPVKLL